MIRVHSKITEQLAPSFVLGHDTHYFIFFKHYSELILVHKLSYFLTDQNVVFGVNVLMNVCADCCAYRHVNANHVSYYCFSLTRLLLLMSGVCFLTLLLPSSKVLTFVIV